MEVHEVEDGGSLFGCTLCKAKLGLRLGVEDVFPDSGIEKLVSPSAAVWYPVGNLAVSIMVISWSPFGNLK